MRNGGLTHLSLAMAGGSSADTPLPNRRGMTTGSNFELSGSVYWQPNDFLIVNAGLVAFNDERIAAGSFVSFGVEHAQLDIGLRDHWLSPMTDSAMLLGVQAQTMPSVTLSSYVPMTRWGFRYEIFLAEMSESSRIAFDGGFTAGNPRLAGMHVSFQPLPGWAIGVNRVMQYGGGAREESLGDLIDAFFRPSQADNTGTTADFGNQAASFTSRFVMPGELQFAVYFEYGGEDTSKTSNFHLGNSALSAGIHFPSLWRDIELTIELGEWQNGWYAHHIYQDGLRHRGNVIGHWGSDLRALADDVGAQSIMARVGWEPRFGGMLEATYRSLDNESYSAPDYERMHALELRYSRGWRDFLFGTEMYFATDVFGDSHSRIGAFLRF
jgi:hypothetical protein